MMTGKTQMKWELQGIGLMTGSRNPITVSENEGCKEAVQASWAKDKAYIASEVNTIESEGL
ncbi:MAG TPA: hypothetical protein PLG72_05575 [Clostridiales bacterium]|nr:hypothetical protein [Clostridiales bacterium]